MEASVASAPVSPQVADLIRQGAQIVLELPEQVMAELDEVALRALPHEIAEDPGLAAGIRRTNRGFVRGWAEANLREPGAVVTPTIGPEMLAIGRDLVRRGLDDSTPEAFRAGQNVVWRRWRSHRHIDLRLRPQDASGDLRADAEGARGAQARHPYDAVRNSLSDHRRGPDRARPGIAASGSQARTVRTWTGSSA